MLYSPTSNLERSEMEMLGRAKVSIDIAMYSFTDKKLAEELCRVARSGCECASTATAPSTSRRASGDVDDPIGWREDPHGEGGGKGASESALRSRYIGRSPARRSQMTVTGRCTFPAPESGVCIGEFGSNPALSFSEARFSLPTRKSDECS